MLGEVPDPSLFWPTIGEVSESLTTTNQTVYFRLEREQLLRIEIQPRYCEESGASFSCGKSYCPAPVRQLGAVNVRDLNLLGL